jgi:hypothetical protein
MSMSWVGKNGIWALLKVVGLTPGLAVLQGQQPLWRKKGSGGFSAEGGPRVLVHRTTWYKIYEMQIMKMRESSFDSVVGFIFHAHVAFIRYS